MARFISDINVETVGDLKAYLSVLPDDMRVSDSVGELLCVRMYEEENEKFLEVA